MKAEKSNDLSGSRRLAVRAALTSAIALATPNPEAAKLSAPVNWGSPDQAYASRRAVTGADRALIQRYRSAALQPTFTSDFHDEAELQKQWTFVSDDNQWGGFQSCRRPASLEASREGLRLKTLIAADCRNRWSTGYIVSKAKYAYGFFEAKIKIADVKGMNNAFWMNVTGGPDAGVDHYEIDISEVQYPSYDHLGIQQYPARGNTSLKYTGVGWGAGFVDDMSSAFHDYGVLWTPAEIIFEIDGEPVAAALTRGTVAGHADVRFSTALIYAGVPEHPEGHDMIVKSLRFVASPMP